MTCNQPTKNKFLFSFMSRKIWPTFVRMANPRLALSLSPARAVPVLTGNRRSSNARRSAAASPRSAHLPIASALSSSASARNASKPSLTNPRYNYRSKSPQAATKRYNNNPQRMRDRRMADLLRRVMLAYPARRR